MVEIVVPELWISSAMAMAMSIYRTLCVVVFFVANFFLWQIGPCENVEPNLPGLTVRGRGSIFPKPV